MDVTKLQFFKCPLKADSKKSPQIARGKCQNLDHKLTCLDCITLQSFWGPHHDLKRYDDADRKGSEI